jgi:hypothetical protein
MVIALISNDYIRAMSVRTVHHRSGEAAIDPAGLKAKMLTIDEKVYSVKRAVKADRVCCLCIVDRKLCSSTFVNKHRLTNRNHVVGYFIAAGSSLGEFYHEKWIREGKTVCV